MTECWEISNKTLQTAPLKGSHTIAALAEHLKSISEEWDMEPFVICTDNAKNITGAVAALNQQPCEEEDKSSPYIDKIYNVGCFAHTINLATQKGIAAKSLGGTLARVRKIVKYFRKSTLASK